MYHCPVEEELKNNKVDRPKLLNEEEWLWHYQNCCCLHMNGYMFFRSALDDHVRAFAEHKGFLEVHWRNELQSMTLGFPTGLVEYYFGTSKLCNYPY